MALQPETSASDIVRGLAGMLAVMALVLALAAWSLSWWQAWAFLATFGGCSVLLVIDLARRDPALLRRRMRSGPAAEKESSQKLIQAINGAGFLGLLIVPGLDHRFGWSSVPLEAVIAGHVLIVACYLGWAMVFRDNTFAFSTIEVEAGQRVVDTGTYAFVRHPMYATGLPLFVGIPLALGSYWGLIVSAVLLAGIVARLLHEERFLAARLPGYADYMRRVRFRLVPGVW